MKKMFFHTILKMLCICIFFANISCKQKIQMQEFFLPNQEELLQKTEQFFTKEKAEINKKNDYTNFQNNEFWKIVVNRADKIEEFFLDRDEKSFLIETDLFSPIAIFAYPFQNSKEKVVSSDSKYNLYIKDFFLPAGTVFPGKTQLSWLLGFEANILNTIYSLSKNDSIKSEEIKNYAAHFNWQKFAELLETKESDFKNFYNPWNLETSTIISGIKCADFKSSYLSQKKNLFFSNTIFFQNLNCSELPIISRYIPQNCRIDCIALKQDKNEMFLCKKDDFYIITVIANSQKELSLELNQ